MTKQTKYRLGEQLITLLGNKVTGSKITLSQAMLAVSQATNKYIRDVIYLAKRNGEEIIPYAFIREYESKTVKKRNSTVIPLPVRTIDTLHNNLGVFEVLMCDEPLIPLTSGFMSSFRGLEAFGLEGMLGYIPKRDELVIVGDDIEEGVCVTIKLIPDSTNLSPDDYLPAPSDGEAEILAIAAQILQVQLQLPENNSNDNI